ncbi:MAG: AAA family ATPase [Gammaproteobacteria bacterium]|nr:AAA family ATPase [Gammaproteobacteria bacterium]
MIINLPKLNEQDKQELDLNATGNLVVVGANGSGKSRFGSYIERKSSGNVRRISAQRMLRLVNNPPMAHNDQASLQLINAHRNEPVTTPHDDYQHVLSALFAEKTKKDSDYVKASQESRSSEKPKLPDSAIDKLTAMWDAVFPHRKILLEERKIEVEGKNSTRYPGSEMSDGEKIALYLMAQCLLLPSNYLVIIDEPELHLHKALMARLWDKIETVRNDCFFIYITHDLDFASSRVDASKIWIKNYHDEIWDWCFLPVEESLPEKFLFEVIGSKKPVLFVESEIGGLDSVLYQLHYSDFTVIGRGSCEKVIEAVKGLKNNSDLHSLEVYGLIDRDHRTDQEIIALERCSVHVLGVSEVENLFLLPELVRLLSDQMLVENQFSNVKNTVINAFKSELEQLALRKISRDLYYELSLKAANCKHKNIEELKTSVSEMLSASKIEEKYHEVKRSLDAMSISENYLEILKVYNNKGLCSRVASHFGLATKGNIYQKTIIKMFKGDKGNQIRDVLDAYLPKLKGELVC